MDRFQDHVRELKSRAVRSAVFLVAATAASFYYSSEVLAYLQADLGVQTHALKAYEVFYTQVSIALIAGFFLSLPFVLYELLKFLKPGLKPDEYRVLRNYLPLSIVLFTAGAAFAYQFVVKTSLRFFQSLGQSASVEAVWGLSNTLGFALKLSAFTGLFFQLPILALVLARAEMLTSGTMKRYRKEFLVVALLASALATPPDIFTMMMVALPVVGLYELSVWLVKGTER